jgi:hypothetical protein
MIESLSSETGEVRDKELEDCLESIGVEFEKR